MPVEPNSDELMRALIRASRPLPPIDAERMAQAREAVHTAWLDATTPRVRVWRAAAAAAAAAAIVIAAVTLRSPRPDAPPATPAVASIGFFAGHLHLREAGAGAGRRPQFGERLDAGAELVTGNAGRGALVLAGAIDLRMDEATRLVLESAERVRLESGAIYVDTASRGNPGASIEVAARGAIVRTIGTRYQVRVAGEGLEVRVRDGRVQVRRGGQAHDAPPASLLTLLDGDVRVRHAAPFGPEWEWIVQAARPPDINGRSLAEFLDWVARESARDVRFDDDSLARAAPGTIVYGSLEGLTLAEALDLVLSSCGLSHRLDGGAIVIGAAAEGPSP